jgi:hypothetical protein
MARTLINAPARPSVCDIIETAPPLATRWKPAFRPGIGYKPRNIIQRFPASTTAEVFNATFSAIAANPILAFFIRAWYGGTL